MIRLLLSVGAATTKEGQVASSEGGLIPLHVAAMSGDVASVQLLLAAGAPINAQSASGSTPLHLATEKGHLGVLCELLGYAGI